eukprot:3514602-Ditylum_brightwellii.AAC.1
MQEACSCSDVRAGPRAIAQICQLLAQSIVGLRAPKVVGSSPDLSEVLLWSWAQMGTRPQGSWGKFTNFIGRPLVLEGRKRACHVPAEKDAGRLSENPVHWSMCITY